MTPLNTLKIRGLDHETSHCINTSFSINKNRLSNKSFSEQSIIKKSEEISEEKIFNNKKKNIRPISQVKPSPTQVNDISLPLIPIQLVKKKNKKYRKNIGVKHKFSKPKSDEIEIKGISKQITPK